MLIEHCFRIELFQTGKLTCCRIILSLVGAPLFVARLSFGALIAEHFHLAIAPIHRQSTIPKLVERVDLQMQRQTLHALLIAEICAQALNGDVDFGVLLHRIPVERDRVVRHLLDRANDAGGVLRVRIQDTLLDRVLPGVPELPGLDLFVVRFLLTKDQQYQ